MSIFTGVARQYNALLVQSYFPKNMSPDGVYEAVAGFVNAKVVLFNVCTGGVVGCFALGFFRFLSPVSALALGGGCFVGRQVAAESFKETLPEKIKNQVSDKIQTVVPSKVVGLWASMGIDEIVSRVLMPRPLRKYGEIVIFYQTVPPTLGNVAELINQEVTKAVDAAVNAVGGLVNKMLS
jgi:hypothetical protein